MVCKVHKFNITATFIISGAEDVLFDKNGNKSLCIKFIGE